MSWGFLAFVHAVFGTRGVDSGMRELVGLRVAKLLKNPYQWQQHATMAKNAGLAPHIIEAVAVDGVVTGVSADQSLLCQATDELTQNAEYTDDTLSRLRHRYGDVVVRKITLTTGFLTCCAGFSMVAACRLKRPIRWATARYLISPLACQWS